MKKTLSILFAFVALTVAVKAYGETPPPSPFGNQPPHVEFKYYGFYGVVDYTFMTNLNKNHGGYRDMNGIEQTYTDSYILNGITAVAGWQWRKESGLGVGFSYLNDATGSFSQIPVFIEFRSHYLRSRLTPFSVVRLGYSIPFGSVNGDKDYTKIDEGGITAAFLFGGRVAIRPKIAVNMYVGYQLIQLNSVERGFNSVAATRLPELYHNVTAGLGVNF